MKRTKYPQANIARNIGLVKKIALSFHQTTGLELQELISQGYLIYLESMNGWDPKKGKFSTYMWYCLSSGFKNYLLQENKHKAIQVDCLRIPKEEPAYFNLLNDEAWEIARLILKEPDAYVALPKQTVMEKLKKILYNSGWKEERIQAGFNCLQTAFN